MRRFRRLAAENRALLLNFRNLAVPYRCIGSVVFEAQRAGHVPTSINVPWSKAANDDGTFKSDDELREIYGAAGLDDSKETIALCRIGERSSHTWFVLKELLGHQSVKNYDGSWTEYGSLVGVPVALGDEPGEA